MFVNILFELADTGPLRGGGWTAASRSSGETAMHIEAFFDPATSSNTYLVFDADRTRCVVVDSVLDYDPQAARIRTDNADRLIGRVAETGARVEWILETHVHADHLSAAAYLKDAAYLKEQLGGRTAIGRQVTAVQGVFGKLFNAGPGFATDGSQFDHLLADGDSLPMARRSRSAA